MQWLTQKGAPTALAIFKFDMIVSTFFEEFCQNFSGGFTRDSGEFTRDSGGFTRTSFFDILWNHVYQRTSDLILRFHASKITNLPP